MKSRRVHFCQVQCNGMQCTVQEWPREVRTSQPLPPLPSTPVALQPAPPQGTQSQYHTNAKYFLYNAISKPTEWPAELNVYFIDCNFKHSGKFILKNHKVVAYRTKQIQAKHMIKKIYQTILEKHQKEFPEQTNRCRIQSNDAINKEDPKAAKFWACFPNWANIHPLPSLNVS